CPVQPQGASAKGFAYARASWGCPTSQQVLPGPAIGVFSDPPPPAQALGDEVKQMRNGTRPTRERERLDFAKIKTTVQIPNLIDVQKKSYQRFLQMDQLPSEREDAGLQSVFTSVFPIQDFRGLSQLDFVDYAIGNWECKCGH